MRKISYTKRALATIAASAVAMTMFVGANAETLEEPVLDEGTADVTATTDAVTDDAAAEATEAPELVVTDLDAASATIDPNVFDPSEIPNESISLEEFLAETPLELDSMALPAGAKPVYRFWSPTFNGHHYTMDTAEKAKIEKTWPKDWTYEQIAYYAFDKQVTGTIPVFRFWSEMHKAHYFTTSEQETRDMAAKWPGVWKSEGIAFYVYPSDSTAAGTGTIHQFWSQRYGSHFFTSSTAERDKVIKTWPDVWSYEGSRYKVIPGPAVVEKTTQQRIVEEATKYLGYRYANGWTPQTGFDCSGYVRWVVLQATGKTLSWGATSQANQMTRISAAEAKPGDFWFRGVPGSFGHVGVYMGNNKIAHSPDWGRLTSIQTIWTTGYFYRFNG